MEPPMEPPDGLFVQLVIIIIKTTDDNNNNMVGSKRTRHPQLRDGWKL